MTTMVREPTALELVPETTLPGDKTRGYTFFGSMFDLKSQGYIEEEWFYEGTANRYDTPTGEQGSVVSSDHSYRSRFVIRRPADPSRCNGTVLLEWQNVTAGWDLEALWAPSWRHVVREGYIWIGVSAQRVGVTHLRDWSPARYGTLDVTCDGEISDDSLCYDVYAQAAQMCRQRLGPLSEYPVDQVIALGASQSAGRLVVYMNSVLPLSEPVIDGLGLFVGGRGVRTDQGVPIFVVVSETDVLRRGSLNVPDPEGLRRWEIAGTSHSAYAGFSARLVAANRDVGPTGIPECERNPYSRVPGYQVFNAAYNHLCRWAAGGPPPPEAPRILYEQEGENPVLARDEHGIARGGIRLAAVDVPTATSTGINGGPAFCRLYGSHDPFADEKLAKLYPSHDAYVERVCRVANANQRAGYITAADAAETRELAAASDIGR